MFKKNNEEIECLQRAVISVQDDLERLKAAWAKEQLDLTDIKEQVLRNLNRLVARQRADKKSQPELPESPESDNGRSINPLAAGILKGRA